MDGVFPTDPREFDADDRISFSRLDNKFIAVHDDGNEYEFDPGQKRWILTEEDTLDHEAHEYGGGNQAQDVEENGSRKRKNGSGNASEVSSIFEHCEISSRCFPTIETNCWDER